MKAAESRLWQANWWVILSAIRVICGVFSSREIGELFSPEVLAPGFD